jgi:D-sedoheptulose 7-phosphate isomerase
MRTGTLDYIGRLTAALDRLPHDVLEEFGETLYRAYRDDKQVFVLGNGGSASTASHMAADLAKNTIGPNMHRFRIMSLNDNTATLTALANDLGYENVFSEQLISLIRPGDILVVISGSGNSENVLRAMRLARSECAEVAALLGFGGGQAADLADFPIIVASDDYGVVEDIHLVVNHMLVEHFQTRLAEVRPFIA